MKKLTIMYGLPGSGKTIEAKKLKTDNNTLIIDADNIEGDVFAEISERIGMAYGYNKAYIIDGLFTTNNDIENILNKIDYKKYEINVIFFEKDIDACLHNDVGRRSVDSKITIKNIPFEEISDKLIKKYKITVVRKKIVKKNGFELWKSVNSVQQDVLSSDKWSLGGTWGSYTGSSGSISPDPQPISFKEFDDLLFKMCPNIGFLQYKKLYNDSVEIVQDSRGDYYGGSESYAYYQCDMKKLYQSMQLMGIVNEIS